MRKLGAFFLSSHVSLLSVCVCVKNGPQKMPENTQFFFWSGDRPGRLSFHRYTRENYSRPILRTFCLRPKCVRKVSPKTVRKPSQKHPKTLPKRSPTCPTNIKTYQNRTCAGRESNPRPPGWEAAGPTIGLIPRWRSGPKLISYASKIQALTAGAAQRLIRHPKCAFLVVCWAVLLKSDKSRDFVAQAEH